MAEEEKPEYHVYLTSDTMRGILLEAYRHPNLECIVQMAGLRKEMPFILIWCQTAEFMPLIRRRCVKRIMSMQIICVRGFPNIMRFLQAV